MTSILIVEDDITYGMMLKTWLGKKGFQVTSASSIARKELLFMKELSGGLLLAVLAAGQVGVWIYDRAYEYVQVHIWNKFRGKLLN